MPKPPSSFAVLIPMICPNGVVVNKKTVDQLLVIDGKIKNPDN